MKRKIMVLMFSLLLLLSGCGKEAALPEEEGSFLTCEVTIRCDNILKEENRALVSNDSLWDYIPEDGIYLDHYSVTLPQGATAYDALEQAAKEQDILLDASYTPAYESYYIRGIGSLYEKDAGDASGWLYFINEESPSYGASQMPVEEGDQVSFFYTCNYGMDLEGEMK